jgi:hypothetical protein
MGMPNSFLNRDDHAALARAVELGHNQPGEFTALWNSRAWFKAFMPVVASRPAGFHAARRELSCP